MKRTGTLPNPRHRAVGALSVLGFAVALATVAVPLADTPAHAVIPCTGVTLDWRSSKNIDCKLVRHWQFDTLIQGYYYGPWVGPGKVSSLSSIPTKVVSVGHQKQYYS
jgi:hypothetical protein